jgi:hypothetical protein
VTAEWILPTIILGKIFSPILSIQAVKEDTSKMKAIGFVETS